MLAAALPVYGCVLFLLLRPVEKRASLFLAATLFATAFLLTPQIIGYAGFYDVWPGLTFFPFNTKLWIPALFYLHAWSLMNSKPLGWRVFLLLPGVIQTAYYLWAFTCLGDYRAKWDFNDAFHAPYILPLEGSLILFFVLAAAAAIIAMLKHYRIFLQATQSAASDFEPRWILRLFWLAALAGALWLALEIVDIWILPLSYNQAYPVQLILMVLVAFAGLDALSSIREAFPKMDGFVAAIAKSETKNWRAEGQKLKQQIVDEQWFLEPRLTIRDVAARQASNESYISRALNQGLGATFNGFINGLRVNHAQKMLQSGEESLIQIAFASGFNSKATFNRVFKEIVGMTPTDFRRNDSR